MRRNAFYRQYKVPNGVSGYRMLRAMRGAGDPGPLGVYRAHVDGGQCIATVAHVGNRKWIVTGYDTHHATLADAVWFVAENIP